MSCSLGRATSLSADGDDWECARIQRVPKYARATSLDAIPAVRNVTDAGSQ